MDKISFSSRGTRLKEDNSRSRLETQNRLLAKACCDDHVTDDVNYSGLFGDDDDDDEPEKEGDPGFQISQKTFF